MSREEGNDPYLLQRFLDAQEHGYAQALSEIRSGQKRSHWMWFIFPQVDGLGFSAMSQRVYDPFGNRIELLEAR